MTTQMLHRVVKNSIDKVSKEQIKYAEFVSMTEAEYNKLTERFDGNEAYTKTAIEILDNYKVFTKNPKHKAIENKEVKHLTDGIG